MPHHTEGVPPTWPAGSQPNGPPSWCDMSHAPTVVRFACSVQVAALLGEHQAAHEAEADLVVHRPPEPCLPAHLLLLAPCTHHPTAQDLWQREACQPQDAAVCYQSRAGTTESRKTCRRASRGCGLRLVQERRALRRPLEMFLEHDAVKQSRSTSCLKHKKRVDH
jgi:hypothetical protein